MTKVLIAVSGGVDSVVLLDQSVKSGSKVGVAHVHHGLRPESDEEYEFVRSLATKYGVPFHGTRLTFPNGGSQAVYRTARYAFFEEIMQAYGYTQLMTAHHADDELETVLIQLFRNVIEVTGIPERRTFADGELIRPLLTETKQELIAYAQQHQLEWREDASNAQMDYLRNQIRHRIVPELRVSHPELVRQVGETARRQRELWQERYQRMQAWLDRHVYFGMKAFHVKQDELSRFNTFDRYVVGRLLSIRYGVEVREGIERLLESPRASAQFDLEGPFRLRKYDGVILLEETVERMKLPSEQVVSTLPSCVTFGETVFSLEIVDSVRGIPLDAIDLPLTVRPPRVGDAMSLSVGTKKVSRILIDAKVPREKRPFVPLLVDAAGRIIAIVGVRVSDFPNKSDAMCPRLMVK